VATGVNPVTRRPARPSVRGGDGRDLRWEAHRRERRQTFVDAAIGAIDTHGPDVSVSDICRYAAVPRAALYRHFADRADLDDAVASRIIEIVVEMLTPLIEMPDGPLRYGVVRELAARVVGSYIDLEQDHPHLSAFVRAHAGGASVQDAAARALSGVAHRAVTTTRQHVPDIADVPDAQAMVIASAVVGIVDAAVGSWSRAPGGLDRTALTNTIATMIAAAVTGVAAELL
jgi:AcrR family transcriptional regulator